MEKESFEIQTPSFKIECYSLKNQSSCADLTSCSSSLYLASHSTLITQTPKKWDERHRLIPNVQCGDQSKGIRRKNDCFFRI